MALQVSRRRDWVAQSEIRSITIECARVGGINLAQGVCDLEVPEPVRRGAQDAIDRGFNCYTRYDGLAELRQAIALKFKRFSGLEVDPEGEIVVSAGATGAFACTCLALLDPGSEVLVFAPYYGYHLTTLRATGAVPVTLALQPPDWRFTDADLEGLVTERTRAILVNTPGNPSGKVFDRDELERIGRFAERHDLFVITDEIYEHFIYDGFSHLSAAALPGLRIRTITISGLSKTFSITGWRIGYCICDRRWAEAIGHFNDLIYVCAPAPLQIGVAVGLVQLGPDYYRGLADEHQKKRDRLAAALDAAGLAPVRPCGAYYILADLSPLPGASAGDKALHLLKTTGVACVPGTAFGLGSHLESWGRFCFAKQDSVLEDACRRLERLRF